MNEPREVQRSRFFYRHKRGRGVKNEVF